MLNIIILAAGKGTRMRSNLPKVLQPLAARPMIHHVIDTAKALNADKIIVVVGHGADAVTQSINAQYDGIEFITQSEQLGTGHAVLLASTLLDEHAKVIALYADTPLLQVNQLQSMIDATSETQMALLTTELADPTGYGRVKLSDTKTDTIDAVIEQKDAADAEQRIKLINTGVIAGHAQHFLQWLPLIKNDNKQGEYYLPDIIPLANQHDTPVNSVETSDSESTFGINDKRQLAQLERLYQARQADDLMQQGVTLIDPARLDVRGQVSVGKDVCIDANVILEGQVRLGDNVQIGANCILKDCSVGANTVIAPFSSVDQAEIAEHCQIGPYARLRPASVLLEGSKVGNFVEMKKSTLGKNSKANHFTYLGDSTVGEAVNIGAGTITCNYDGVNKHQTHIGDRAFIGSNSSLVAPINIGAGATIGAGSILSGQISGAGLTLTRPPKKHLSNWSRPTKQDKS